jgi:hypothetical protein
VAPLVLAVVSVEVPVVSVVAPLVLAVVSVEVPVVVLAVLGPHTVPGPLSIDAELVPVVVSCASAAPVSVSAAAATVVRSFIISSILRLDVFRLGPHPRNETRFPGRPFEERRS